MHREKVIFTGLVAVLMTAEIASGKNEPRLIAGDPSRGADIVLLNGRIWTGEAREGKKAATSPFAQALAILDGRILAVGSNDETAIYVGAKTRVIDLKGRLAAPGLIDSHVHFIDGSFELLEVNLKDSSNEGEFVRRIAEKAKSLPPGRWILGGNWDEEAWPDAKLPTRWMIDPVTPGNPVFIYRYDGHAALANSPALKLAGITRGTESPPGGVIVRDPKSGEPTGVLKDEAEGLVDKVVPPASESEMEQALRAGLAEARRLGVTSVQNISVGTDSAGRGFERELRLLRRAELEGWLTCRFYEITPIADWKKLAGAGLSRGMGDGFIKLGAVKAFADGSLGSRTAWMFDAYDDDPGNRGLPMELMNPPAKMEDAARGADSAGIQLAIHAIGDRANAEVLDLYRRLGPARAPVHRFRVEHAQHVRTEDIVRFGKLGVIASMQPYHAIDDGRWAEKRLGHDRSRTSYAWRSMLNAGVPLAFGSDWPVAPLSPLLGIYAAVTRATLDGKHPAGWFREERLSVEEALRAYTWDSAYAAFEETEKGSITPGKLADIVVLSDDVFKIPPEKIKDARVVYTILGGKVVHESE